MNIHKGKKCNRKKPSDTEVLAELMLWLVYRHPAVRLELVRGTKNKVAAHARQSKGCLRIITRQNRTGILKKCNKIYGSRGSKMSGPADRKGCMSKLRLGRDMWR